jgi:UMF1 family MFS transporter
MSAARPGILERIGLHRPELRAWALYDWANSAYFTTIVVAVFPRYLNDVAGKGLEEGVMTQRLMLATSIAMVLVALIAPVLGAVADIAGAKKRLLAAFASLGVVATAWMFGVHEGDWLLALVLLVLGNVGIAGSLVCYDSLLPSIAAPDEMDRVSSAGYAIGYAGGGLLLLANAAWILRPEWFGLPHGEGLSADQRTLPTRLAFLSVAVWWVLFTIPLLLRVPEPPRGLEPDEQLDARVFRTALSRLSETFRELRGYRQAFLVLLGVLVYGEGIGTIIKLAGSYAADLELDVGVVLPAFLITQFVGIPCAFAFGAIATWIGTRRAIYVTLAVYAAVCAFAFRMETESDFLTLAVLVGVVQGGAQALGRSLFASVVPRHKSAEFFGFFALGSKFAGAIGPAYFYVVARAATASSLVEQEADANRWAILGLVAFFLLGGWILSRVDIEAGRRAARDAEAVVKTVTPR